MELIRDVNLSTLVKRLATSAILSSPLHNSKYMSEEMEGDIKVN